MVAFGCLVKPPCRYKNTLLALFDAVSPSPAGANRPRCDAGAGWCAVGRSRSCRKPLKIALVGIPPPIPNAAILLYFFALFLFMNNSLHFLNLNPRSLRRATMSISTLVASLASDPGLLSASVFTLIAPYFIYQQSQHPIYVPDVWGSQLMNKFVRCFILYFNLD